MNIHDLMSFQVIAKANSLTEASKLLYMTPQGLSKVVKNLEQELSCKLLVRTAAGTSLTESGQCMAEYADKIVADYSELRKEILHIEQSQHGVVDLLSAYGILRLVTPECITAFQKEHPEIEFHYREFPDRQVERLFQEREGNVAFSIADFDEKLYHVTELEMFKVKLLVNEAHPLSKRESVTIHDLKGEPLYIESSEFKIHHMIVDRCRNAGFEPDIVFGTSGFSLCHKMVKANKGISVTVDFVFDDMKEKGMKLIPFSDGVYEWKICMITRRGDTVCEAVDIFKQHIMQWMKRIRDGSITR